MRTSVLAAVLCALALSTCGVNGLQWTGAVVSGGGAFYPGVSVVISCGTGLDIRLNNTMNDGTSLQLAVTPLAGGRTVIVGNPVPAGTVGKFCDACFVPDTGYAIAVRMGIQVLWTGPSTGRPCSHATVTASGNISFPIFTVTPWLGGQYFQATFFSPVSYMPWMATTGFFIGSPNSVTVVTPYDFSDLGGYVEQAPIWLNVSESLYRDGSHPLQMVGPDGGQNATASFLQTNAFYFNARVKNSASIVITSGSIITIDTVGLIDSDTSFFLCAFENMMTGFITESTSSAFNFAVQCLVPDSLTAQSTEGDFIAIKNVTVLLPADANGVQAQALLPFYPPGGALQDFIWTVPQPAQGGGSNGLSSGAVFGIVLTVLVVVFAAIGGGYYYHKYFHGDGAAVAEGRTKLTDGAQSVEDGPQQIQESTSDRPITSSASKGGYGGL